MSHPIAFVEELAEVTLRPNGVSILCRSGAEVFEFRCEIALWRAFLARETDRLTAFDAEQRKRVVPFPKGKRGRH